MYFLHLWAHHGLSRLAEATFRLPLALAAVSASLREKILTAAADLFAERGVAAVSRQQIAQKAHVSKATVYESFPSKKALAHAVLKFEVGKTHAMGISLEVARRGFLSGSLRQAAELYAACIAQRLDRRTIRIRLALALEMGDEFRLPMAAINYAMMDAVRAAQQRGEIIQGEPREIVRALHDALIGKAVLRALAHPITKSPFLPPKLISTFVRI